MLKGTNNADLQKNKKVNDKILFFYQRWQEMLESRTLDMYQYNILNSYVACVDLSEIIDKTLSGLITTQHDAEDAKAEALEIIKVDDVLEKNSNPLRNTLLNILGGKIHPNKQSDKSDEKKKQYDISLNKLKYQLKTPIRLLENVYLKLVLDELKNDIDGNDYKQIERHIAMVISQCIYMGWSTKGLYMLSSFLEGDSCFEKKWENFTQKLSENANSIFKIYYSIKIETRPNLNVNEIQETIKSLNLELKKGREIAESTPKCQDLLSKIDADRNYLVLKVASHDLYSAVLRAINLLNNKLSIATFYNIVNPWIANSPQIVVYNITDNTVLNLKITDIFKTYDYIDSNNNVFEDTKNIFSGSKNHIINKLNSVFAYTNLSRSSVFQETKYLSLWIAIESIMHTRQYQNVISHIKDVLPEVLCIRYIYRIVRNFSEDCMRCGFKNDSTLNINLETDDKNQLVKDLISVFRDPDKFEVLKNRCIINELLKYRCEEIHILLNNKDKIMNKFDNHTRKIRWHIQRLYRIRNEITHSAYNGNKSLVIYIEHLYTYLAQLMSEVVYYVKHKNVESIEEAFETILLNYYTYQEVITTNTLDIQDILPDGVIDIL